MSWGISSVSRLAVTNSTSASASDPEWGCRNRSRRRRVACGFRRGSATQSRANPPFCTGSRPSAATDCASACGGGGRTQDGGQSQVVRGLAAAEPGQRAASVFTVSQEHSGAGHDTSRKPDRVGAGHGVGQLAVNDQVHRPGGCDQATVLVSAGGCQVGGGPVQGSACGHLGGNRAEDVGGTVADGGHGTQNIASSWRRTRPSSSARGGRR